MKILFFAFIGLYLVIVSYMYIVQDSIVFDTTSSKNEPKLSIKNSKEISLEVEDGIFIRGVYKKSKNPNAPLIIYFGGNSNNATNILYHLKNLDKFDILTFNYRGFANSDGKPSQDALFEDAIKIYDKYAKDKNVILIGRSLGTGVASYLAYKRDCKGVILITPYDSIASLGQKLYPYLPVSLLLKHKFESVKFLPHVKTPISLIEVRGDKTIPKYHFDKLKDSIKNLSLHVELKDTTHANVLEHPDFEKTIRKMLKRFELK